MTGLDALQAVQFVSVKGQCFAMLSAEDSEALIDWLESVEGVGIARHALASLKAAGGDRQRAGWSAWKDVAGDIQDLIADLE